MVLCFSADDSAGAVGADVSADAASAADAAGDVGATGCADVADAADAAGTVGAAGAASAAFDLKNLAEHQRKYSAPALSTSEQISLMNFSFTFKRIP